MITASILADVMFQAAVAVGHHAKSTIVSAIHEGTFRSMGHNNESYPVYKECTRIYCQLMGIDPRDPKVWHCSGPTWGMWLTNQGRAEMVTSLLMVYEYIVQEMLGDRVELQSIITPRNDDQTVVHS